MRNYAAYDKHWGAEDNVQTPPPYNSSNIEFSAAGQAVLSLVGFEGTLNKDVVNKLRNEATVTCNRIKNNRTESNAFATEDGTTAGSTSFRCENYCLFDIISDPCEYNEIDDEALIEHGIRLLKLYSLEAVSQTNKPVDLISNPDLREGVWLPWLKSAAPVSASVALDVLLLLFVSLLYQVR